MSQKKIEEIPMQIVTKEIRKIQLRKNLMNTKLNWLFKYISKEHNENNDQNYLVTSIKMQPRTRNQSKRSVLKENRQILNKSHQSAASNQKYQTKNTLDHKYSHIRSRLFTENIENLSKCRKGRNTSLLLNTNNPKQTFNFIENDSRRLGHNLKTDLDLYRRKQRKRTYKTEHDQSKLSPWNLDEQDRKESVLQVHLF